MMILRAENKDCMDVMKEYPDGYFDLAVVDPPFFSGPEKRKYYGNAVSKHGVKRIEYKPLTESWKVPDIQYYNELLRISKEQIIWGINYFEFINRSGPGRIIWDKVNDNSTFSDCEIASCSIEKIKVKIFRFMWRGMMQGTPGNGSKMNGKKSENQKKIHPTQKPIQLYEWIYKNYAKPEFKVIDTHSGSFSNTIAAINFGIKEMVCCEIDKEYFDDGMKRINEYLLQGNLWNNEKITIKKDTQMKIF